ncbi:FAD-dependent oxidoreductase [Natronomonas halophila]|uniref:NAD(P)/FAD-dependent oxidoreductase n=1 Tax=Natronomonas halophila TaxID=2747817 RepID=UPI0015B3BFF7|nr:FAD-dependent oxidoreductase [Natronomonas halophila]QLD84191.1 FAD-dependent oxidoreductase [Natronomonas halophila]
MDIAVVGAGPAGAGVCYALRDTDATVTVFEKSRGVCGRAATRRNDDRRYDHGANYVKSGRDRVDEIITEGLPTDGLVDIEEPVWTFDESGTITEGDDRDDHKWTYEEGITQIAKRLFAETEATVRLETRVGRLSHNGGKWWVLDEDGGDLGTYDAVVLTPPAPQTADILAATEWADSLLVELEAALESVSYRSIYSVILGYPFEIETSWYGLVNTDRGHAIGWLSREELKDGHVPDGESLLVVQMSPDWTVDRFGDPKSAAIDDAASLVADLLDDERLADPDWTDTQRWRYALPNESVDADLLRKSEDDGLYFAGDWVVGDGRVHLALENGLDVGERIPTE